MKTKSQTALDWCKDNLPTVFTAWGVCIALISINLWWITSVYGYNWYQYGWITHAFYVPEPTVLQTFLLSCVLAPVVEEALFRLAGVQAVRALCKNNIKAMWSIFLGITVIFSWIHWGTLSVPVQGVLSMACYWVYMKNNSSVLTSYISAVLVHAGWNIFCIYLIKLYC